MTSKICSTCRNIKTIGEFSTRGYGPNKTHPRSDCKSCCAIKAKEWRSRNPQKSVAASNKWRANNPDKVKVISRRRVLKKHGLTLEAFDQMLKDQKGRCANLGCGIALTSGWTINSAMVDHNHTTNKVRAILCQGCNVALGMLRENIQSIKGLAKYLEIYA